MPFQLTREGAVRRGLRRAWCLVAHAGQKLPPLELHQDMKNTLSHTAIRRLVQARGSADSWARRRVLLTARNDGWGNTSRVALWNQRWRGQTG